MRDAAVDARPDLVDTRPGIPDEADNNSNYKIRCSAMQLWLLAVEVDLGVL